MHGKQRLIAIFIVFAVCMTLVYKEIMYVGKAHPSHKYVKNLVKIRDLDYAVTTESEIHDTKDVKMTNRFQADLEMDLYKRMGKFNITKSIMYKMADLYEEIEQSSPEQKSKLDIFLRVMNFMNMLSENTRQKLSGNSRNQGTVMVSNNVGNEREKIIGQKSATRSVMEKTKGLRESQNTSVPIYRNVKTVRKFSNKSLNVNMTDKQSNLSLPEEEAPRTCNHCFDNDFKYIINNESFCKHLEDLNLIIFIASAPGNKQGRTTIRETWGQLCVESSQVRYAFVLGRTYNEIAMKDLETESSAFGDIIQFDFIDSYANLTYKTLSALKWVDQYCPNAKFVMKTDTDVYLNMDLIPLLVKALPRNNFQGGMCWGTSKPHRETSSKWYVSFRSFSGLFPPMCSGTGYIISADVVPKVLNVSQNIPFFYLEDVYIALCMQKIGVVPVKIDGFDNMMSQFEKCYYRNRVLTSHLVNSFVLRSYWAMSRECALLDKKPSEVYNPMSLRNID